MKTSKRGQQDYRGLLIVGGIGLLSIIILVSLFGDFLGVRLIKKGSPRLSVHRGDKVTLELANSPHTRKLEICTEKKNLILSYSDFTNCRPLQYSVGPHVTRADVTIPNDFPLARAVVITRLRDANGTLVPAAPTDEKIALWITPAAPKTAQKTSKSSNSGGGGGGGEGEGGGSSNSNSGNSPSTPAINFNLQKVCVDPQDYEVFVQWQPQDSIIRFKLPHEDTWHYPYKLIGTPYTDSQGVRYTLIFNHDTEPAYYTNNEPDPYPLGPNQDFEFQLQSNSQLNTYSEIYRFNTGTKPAEASLHEKYCIYP